MSLKAIRSSVHSQSLNYRNLDGLITSDDFAIAYNNATESERAEVEIVIARMDKVALRTFIRRQLSKLTPFHKMGLKKLREIGRNIRVPKYWAISKGTLIEEIEDVVKRLKEDRD